MQEIFNDAAGIGEDAPVWSSGPFPTWGSNIFDASDDDEYPGDPIARAVENYAAVMGSVHDLSDSWGMVADAGDEWEASQAALRAATARDEEARRRAFDEELAGASILQQPLRVSKPFVLRARFVN